MVNKILTLVEGRTVNYRTINDMKKQTAEAGWGFRLLDEIPHLAISKCAFREYFSNYVMWRDLNDNNSAVEVERILRWLDKNKQIISINTHLVGGRNFSSDKFYQHGLFGMNAELQKYTPVVFLVYSRADVINLVQNGHLKFPIVLKERFGTAGKGIVLIENENDLDKIKNWRMLLAEPYIEADYDWRVFVVGGVAVGAMRKTISEAESGDFIAKSAGKGKSVEKDKDVLKVISRIACLMAAVCGLEYAGCDIIREKKTGRYFVLETNNSAGWQNHFNDITGLNMGQILLEWFEDRGAINEEIDFYRVVKKYIEHRLQYLDERYVGLYWRILNFEEDVRIVEDDRNIDERLKKSYLELKNGKISHDTKCLIDEIEHAPLCWAGNFIGSRVWGEDGVLEDSIVPSACYLAIREKYDKIVGVNKGKL